MTCENQIYSYVIGQHIYACLLAVTRTTAAVLVIALTLYSNSAISSDYPTNPWGGEWEHIYDGKTFTNELWIENKRNVLIINNTIRGVNGKKSSLRIKNSSRVLVTNNTISGHRYKGHGSSILIDKGTQQIIIDNNRISDADGNGIATEGSSSKCCPHDNPVPGLVIRNNLIHDVGKYHITTAHSPHHGMYIKAQDAKIENNTIYNSFDGSGISIRSTGVVRGNLIYNVKGSHIGYWPQKQGGDSEWLLVENNVVYQDSSFPRSSNNEAMIALGGNKTPQFDKFVIRFNTVVAFAGTGRSVAMINLASDHYPNVRAYANVLADFRGSSGRYLTRSNDAKYLRQNITTTSRDGFRSVSSRDFNVTETHSAVAYATGVENYPRRDKEGRLRDANSLDAGAYAYTFDESNDAADDDQTRQPPANNNPENNFNGAKRIIDQWLGRHLHASGDWDWAEVKSAPKNDAWRSQQWIFEKVSGDRYRIKNLWTGRYLTAPSQNDWDTLFVAPLDLSWESQMWDIEANDRDYRIRNAWSKRYLHTSEPAWSLMIQAPLDATWDSQRYRIE